MAKNKNNKKSEKLNKKVKKKTLWKRLFKYAFILGVWSAMGVMAFLFYLSMSLPDVEQISKRSNMRPEITFLDINGNVITTYGDSYNRVPISNIPDSLVDAVVATEDRRFFEHSGFDSKGFARAMMVNLQKRRLAQGGSTITQQLAKNLFLTNEKTITRKLQEMILALYIETKFSKDEILESYLNNVYFGSGNYGVEAAANDFFGKSIYDINFEESVILAGLLKAPSSYNPKYHLDKSIARAEVVIIAMKGNEVQIPDYDFEQVIITSSKSNPELGNARYFADIVSDSIYGYIGEPKQDITVQTTFNPDLQKLAEISVANYREEIQKKDGDQIAFVSMQQDGGVVAMMGGFDYSESQFNRATQAHRQTGSVFKPIVYLAALEEGMKPWDDVYDTPLKIGDWEPQNFDHKFKGEMELEYALAKSRNIPAIRVMQKVGVDKVISTARKLGITANLERNLTTALGSNAMTLMELTNAYAMMSNKGYAVEPYTIKSIYTNSGDVLYEHDNDTQRVLEKKPVKYINRMLEETVDSGTAKKAKIRGVDVYGKTGTTQDYKDAWFIGYTEKLITGVWIGNDDATPTQGITGGSIPAKIWHAFNKEADEIAEEKGAVPKRSFWDIIF